MLGKSASWGGFPVVPIVEWKKMVKQKHFKILKNIFAYNCKLPLWSYVLKLAGCSACSQISAELPWMGGLAPFKDELI